MLRLEASLNADGETTIFYDDDNSIDAATFAKIIGIQKFYIGTKFSRQGHNDLFEVFRYNFCEMSWNQGPSVCLLSNQGEEMFFSNCWGTSPQQTFQVVIIFKEQILQEINVGGYTEIDSLT